MRKTIKIYIKFQSIVTGKDIVKVG